MRLQALDMRHSRTGGPHDGIGRAVAPDPGIVRAGLRRQFRHPHGVALAQERLPQGAERGQAEGRAAPARDSARRLHGAPPVEPGGDALPRVRGQDKQGPNLIVTVIPNGPWSMRQSLTLWFLYAVVVGAFAGYVAGRA